MTQKHLGIGIDTGGTFTDIVLFDLGAEAILRKAKTPTTHGNYAVCIARAFEALALSGAEIAALARVALSTTLATNTVAEDKVHPTGLIIEPGDISIPAGFHPHLALLKSEIGFDANELHPVSAVEVLQKTEAMAPLVEGFAVSGYASTRNPEHERQIAVILREAYGKPVVLGSELTHQLNFMQRARAAALNAGLLPVILEWLQAVKSILAGLEIRCPLYIVKGDGSLMEEREALEQPVQTLFSGPAASLRGGAWLSTAPESVVVDVGGTTTDIGRIREGRGRLRRGGLLINHQSIAVDGLDIATFGLGGDSRFAVTGTDTYRFINQRVLPFCRAADRYPGFDLDAVEAALADHWHFNDPELIEMVGQDQAGMARGGSNGGGNGNGLLANLPEAQRAIVEGLANGPRRIRELRDALGVQNFAGQLSDLVRLRLVVPICLTPTDLFCADGKAPGFSREAAEKALAMHAHMLDMVPEDFRAALWDTLRRQAGETLAAFLFDHGAPLVPGNEAMEVIGRFMQTPLGSNRPRLSLHPGCPVVLAGAGAPVLFDGAPGELGEVMEIPEHGEVANALGAITSQFVLRENLSLEPVKSGGVEMFDHHGKTFFDSLEEGLAHGRAQLHEILHGRATELGLHGVHYELREDVLEDYADYSRRARKQLVIARLEATLTGMPG